MTCACVSQDSDVILFYYKAGHIRYLIGNTMYTQMLCYDFMMKSDLSSIAGYRLDLDFGG